MCLLFFIFPMNEYPWIIMKNAFYFIWKTLFVLEIFQFLYLSSLRFFFSVSHCFREWLKINLKVYDIINCLNKNLKTHCLVFWEGENDIENLSISRVFNTLFFIRTDLQEQKPSPRQKKLRTRQEQNQACCPTEYQN